MASYIIRFDDIYAGMEKNNFNRVVDFILENSIRAIIGVVPAWEDSLPVKEPISADEFWPQILTLQNSGCEIALHGYSHLLFPHDNILKVHPYGEFPGLSYRDQLKLIRKGIKVLNDHRISCRTFMPPAHSFDRNTLKALRDSGIEIVTDGKSFYPYRDMGLLFFPQISSSCQAFPWGIITICLHPQWLRESDYQEFERFCKTRCDSIVNVQFGIDYFARMNWMMRAVDNTVRAGYVICKSARRAAARGERQTASANH